MAKIIFICGKICSGKTHYCDILKKDYNAVLLSCDEILSQLLGNALAESHDIVLTKTKKYLHQKSTEIVLAGTNVILDWGFWNKSERKAVSEYYHSKNITYEWHYIDISNEDWQLNIISRNNAVDAKLTSDHYIDEGLLSKMKSLFEIPDKSEIDVWYCNHRL